MKLETDSFPMNMNMINFEEKRVLVRTSQVESTRGKNVIVSEIPWARMIKPKSPEPWVWKTNQRHWNRPRVRVTSDLLIEKYSRQKEASVFQRLGSVKRRRSPSGDPVCTTQKWSRGSYRHREGVARYSRYTMAGERGMYEDNQREIRQRSGA
jgi:hypothetical protein